MRILVFGRGTIATIHGLAFQRSGHEVEFYVRPGRAAMYGPIVDTDVFDATRSRLGRRFRRSTSIRLRESLDGAEDFDLVVLGVGHHHLAEAAAVLHPAIGRVPVVILGNVWGDLRTAALPLPTDQVVFGFPAAGGGFGQDGILHGAAMSTVALDAESALAPEAVSAVRSVFRDAGFSVREQHDMEGWLRLHFAFDAGMYAAGLTRGGLAGMIGDRSAFREALEVTRELLPLLRAQGVDLDAHRRSTFPCRRAAVTSRVMAWATRLVPMAQVSLSAHSETASAEARAVLRDIHQDAQFLGVPTPLLDTAMATIAEMKR